MSFRRPISKDARIYVAGHGGLVGSALVNELKERGYQNLLTRTRTEMDLTRDSQVRAFFEREKPELVILAAAKVGGIGANDRLRGDFILENLRIAANVIGAAFENSVEKFVFLGSSCIYPKHAPQPMAETALLSGALEPTNEAYAVAKIAGLTLCKSLNLQYGRRFISVMPTNVYGVGDRYNEQDSHVLPSLLMKFHKAKMSGASSVQAWGTGSALREFIDSRDLASATIFCLENYEDVEHINIGSGQEVSIRKLTEIIQEVTGFQGRVEWDSSKPDGTPRKLLDSNKLFSLGWKPRIDLRDGVARAYADYVKRFGNSTVD